jgi:hypothetical protein
MHCVLGKTEREFDFDPSCVPVDVRIKVAQLVLKEKPYLYAVNKVSSSNHSFFSFMLLTFDLILVSLFFYFSWAIIR